MKTAIRKLFAPILVKFESGEDEYNYKKSHRTILIIVGCLFLSLSLISTIAAIASSQLGAVVPILVFLSAGSVCLVIGSCGSDRAVAKIWRSR